MKILVLIMKLMTSNQEIHNFKHLENTKLFNDPMLVTSTIDPTILSKSLHVIERIKSGENPYQLTNPILIL